MDCSHEMQIEHASMLATHEVKIDTMEKTISDFSVIKDALLKLTFISEQSMEFNKMQLKSNEKVEKSLKGINDNLSQLNNRVGCLENHDKRQECSIAEIKVDDKRLKSERAKAQWSFWGIVITGTFLIIKTLVEIAFS